MSFADFRDPQSPDQIIQAKLAAPPQRRAAPLAAWFMLTAVMAAQSAVLGTALTGYEWTDALLGTSIRLFIGCGVGAALGGLSGVFDPARLRGSALGAMMGGLVGLTSVAAMMIPASKIDLAFHASALAALCIVASAIMGRWTR